MNDVEEKRAEEMFVLMDRFFFSYEFVISLTDVKRKQLMERVK
jgi:hypothetical protein